MQTRYILLISALISVIFSSLASVIPIGTMNQAEVSGLYSTLFTPAAYTFSIWSIIYFSWFVLGLMQALGKIIVLKENAYLLGVTQVLSSIWLIPSQFLWIGTSLIVMIGVLYLLWLLFLNSRKENKIFMGISELFLGWILVASIANLHLFLVAWNIYYLPITITILSIIGALFIFLYLQVAYKSYIPSLVGVWAGLGIFVGQDIYLIKVLGLGLGIILLTYILLQKYPHIKK